MLPAHIDYGQLLGYRLWLGAVLSKKVLLPIVSSDYPLLQRQRLLIDPLGLFVIALPA